MAETYMSRAGYEKLKKELENLKIEKQALSKEIGEAASQGDLSENFGYHAAKARQGEILQRINVLEGKLKSARLIEELKVNKDEARIGATVTLREKASQEEFIYTLVGAEEGDPANGKISVMSPIAQAILGAKVGQEINVNLPAGQRVFAVVTVEYR
jgi:transcription elongation factor GreA